MVKALAAEEALHKLEPHERQKAKANQLGKYLRAVKVLVVKAVPHKLKPKGQGVAHLKLRHRATKVVLLNVRLKALEAVRRKVQEAKVLKVVILEVNLKALKVVLHKLERKVLKVVHLK